MTRVNLSICRVLDLLHTTQQGVSHPTAWPNNWSIHHFSSENQVKRMLCRTFVFAKHRLRTNPVERHNNFGTTFAKIGDSSLKSMFAYFCIKIWHRMIWHKIRAAPAALAPAGMWLSVGPGEGLQHHRSWKVGTHLDQGMKSCLAKISKVIKPYQSDYQSPDH